MNNGRWISGELKPLHGYIDKGLTDIRSGNLRSAETNCSLAMGIIQGMIKREKQSLRGVDKMGATVKLFYKKIKPLLREVAKEAVKEYARGEARG